jgi:hypothetical protein
MNVIHCNECRFYCDELPETDDLPLHGTCRRYPPQLVGPTSDVERGDIYMPHDDIGEWAFPQVQPLHDWCGEFQSK